MATYQNWITSRELREKMQGNIIHWWQIQPLAPPPPPVVEQPVEKSEELLMAEEIIARLEREKAEDDMAKQAEIDQAFLEAAGGVSESDYNAATGSYSGAYGKNVTLDESGLSQVGDILNQHSTDFSDLFNNAK